jgi:hypothetical protein
MMNGWGGTWFARKESSQTVIDVVPGVIGLGGNSRAHQDERQHRDQANARQMPLIKAHCKQFIVRFQSGVKQKKRSRLKSSVFAICRTPRKRRQSGCGGFNR